MRIIAGAYKGRKLLGPVGRVTRPITALVKKSLFGMLGGAVEEAVVLDLYCGVGTLGLEALSRGARLCYFAERDKAALARLARNIEAVGASEQAVVWRGDVTAGLARRLGELEAAADLVFVDPPYATSGGWSWPRVEAELFAPLSERMSPGGLVVLRTAARVEPPERLGSLAAERCRQYGGMLVSLYRLAGE